MMKNVQAVSVIYHGRKVGTLSMGNRSNCQFRRMAFNVISASPALDACKLWRKSKKEQKN